MHSQDPDRIAARREAAARGGSCPRRPEIPLRGKLSAEEGQQLIAAATEMLLKNEIAPSAARAVATLINANRLLVEISEIQAKLEELEKGA